MRAISYRGIVRTFTGKPKHSIRDIRKMYSTIVEPNDKEDNITFITEEEQRNIVKELRKNLKAAR